MIGWLVILILAVIAGIFLKVSHVKNRMTLVVLVLLALFLVGTVGIIFKTNDLEIDSTEGFFNVVKVYTGWLINGFGNMKTIIGNAIKMDWASTKGEVEIFNRTIGNK